MNFWDIIIIAINFLGALGIFLFGMTLMSNGLQKVAGSRMRNILSKITSNPASGILAGVTVTSIIQSSSATTVMVVSFVNAGLMTLAGAIAVIMGANIGTTVTSWIILLFGLGGEGGGFSLALLAGAIALAFFFAKKNKMKSLGEFIFGFAILLVGLDFLQAAMPDLQQYPEALKIIASLGNYGFFSTILLILIGAGLTCLVQSSSAMMAIIMVLCFKGWIDFDMATALILGDNIGTTITANLAAMVGNTTAKRAARAHLVFNVVGVILTLLVLRPELSLIANVTEAATGISPYHTDPLTAGYSVSFGISLFHTLFNVTNTLIQVWFIPDIIKIVTWMVPGKKEETQDEFRLTYISHGYMNTAELSLQAAKKEVEEFGDLVMSMYKLLPDLRTATGEDEFNKLFARIERYEALTDRMELELTNYLTHINGSDLSQQGGQLISTLLRIIDNLESIGDSILQLAITRKNKRDTAVHFDQSLNDNLAHMDGLVQQALTTMLDNLHGDYDQIDLGKAYGAEAAINKYRDQLRERHLVALKQGSYDYAIGTAYSSLYALYEKLGDYVINVSESIDNTKKVQDNEDQLHQLAIEGKE